MSRIIVTGAGGEVGQNLIPLFSRKDEIIAIDKNKGNLSILKRLNPYVKTICADLAEQGDWSRCFSKADYVVSLHAQISTARWSAYERNNIIATRNVVSLCEKHKIKHLVYASSSVVASVADDGYTRSKRKAEQIVMKSSVPYTILRPTLMYGCFDVKHLGYLISFFEKSPIFLMPGSGNYIRQPLFVVDFCRVILSALKMAPKGKAYDISGFEKITLIDCIRTIYKETGSRKAIVRLPLPVFYMLIRMYKFLNPESRIIPDQLRALTAGDVFRVIRWDRIFSVQPTPFSEGIKQVAGSECYPFPKGMTRLES
ncbi:NAD-dependent epimerase/dehydratase family protein [Candidatus Woesearchaeota archaeon]|nr:NAD-dependent epimerase/dehydratase family protein [Candidatus Woesearchaeota archaeon]